jgi:hypothetical protein
MSGSVGKASASLHGADDFVAQEGGGAVMPGVHAPSTTMKEEIIAESRSEGSRIAHALGGIAIAALTNENNKTDKQKKVVFAVEDVRDFVADRRGLVRHARQFESALTLRKALRDAGMLEPLRKAGKATRRFKVGGRMSDVVANFRIEAGVSWKDIEDLYKKPADLWPM